MPLEIPLLTGNHRYIIIYYLLKKISGFSNIYLRRGIFREEEDQAKKKKRKFVRLPTGNNVLKIPLDRQQCFATVSPYYTTTLEKFYDLKKKNDHFFPTKYTYLFAQNTLYIYYCS